ncbi:ABC transporter substrate-binding protein [Kineococcus sp. SYSU DK001]|uniref:ABC transporter substrate-binding protein n=1 Tax=Kineococcus sp. SYSU DK001 TaxID=3383122 RepID=UPI003D7CDD0C
MTTPVSRRTALTGAVLGASAIGLGGCARFGGNSSSGSGDGSGVQLTLMAWADATQAAQYEKVFATFHEKNPGVTVTLEWMDVASYQDKLNTKFAAGSPPDVMFLVGRWLGEYASRGALANLDEHTDVLDFDAMDAKLLESSRLGGTTYAVPTGSTTNGLVYNTKVLADAGLTLPDDATWTWEEFAAFNVEITRATGGKTYGTGFNIPYTPTVAQWANQRGESLYTEDGQLGLTAATLADYFQMTVDLRNAGGYAPAGSLTDDTGSDTAQSALGKGFVASQSIPANVFHDYNVALDGNLALVRFPGEVPTPGYQVTPTLLWGLAAGSKHPAEAATLIDFLTNDPDSFADRSTLLGVPINPEVGATVSETLEPDGKTFVDFLLALQEEDLPPYHLEPAGAGEIADNLVSVGTEVEFGRLTPQAAAEAFVTSAQETLARSAG